MTQQEYESLLDNPIEAKRFVRSNWNDLGDLLALFAIVVLGVFLGGLS